jgi:hypothetical protein
MMASDPEFRSAGRRTPMVTKTGDPIALWQQMVGEMQKGFGAFAKQALAAQRPRNSADQAAAAPAGSQKQLADLMESYFIGMNLPSRTQLTAMTERLTAIEAQLSEIKALLQQTSKPSQPEEPRPSQPPRPRVRRPAAPSEPKQTSAGTRSDREPST